MDLKKTYGSDAELELNGAWIDWGDGARMKIARIGNENHRKILEKLRKPYRSLALSGRQIPDHIAEEIVIKSMAEAVLLDWEGVTVGGKAMKYSKENAEKMLKDLPDFREEVLRVASTKAVYAKEELEEAAKN